MASHTITVTITKNGGTYEAKCTPPSLPLIHRESVTWEVTGAVPAGYGVAIQLPSGVTPVLLTCSPVGGKWIGTASSVQGPRTPWETRPEEPFDGIYQVLLTGTAPPTVDHKTNSKLMIDKGGPPPDNQIYPHGPRPGQDPHPGRGPGASG
jgi:hypothetical protein